MSKIILLTLFLSFHTQSSVTDTAEIKRLAKNFITAIHSRDKELYSQSVSSEFFTQQKKIGFIKKTFTGKVDLNKKIDFDFSLKKGAAEKNYYFMNIKEKAQKEFSDLWFIVKKVKGKPFIIHGVHHFEE